MPATGLTTKDLTERYPMTNDQPAQIDCRVETCIFHVKAKCTNVSPALTLMASGKFTCWSRTDARNDVVIPVRPGPSETKSPKGI